MRVRDNFITAHFPWKHIETYARMPQFIREIKRRRWSDRQTNLCGGSNKVRFNGGASAVDQQLNERRQNTTTRLFFKFRLHFENHLSK
jgi:hypothetical protein